MCAVRRKTSDPERLLSLEESCSQTYVAATKAGKVMYPQMFVVWMDWKVNEANTTTIYYTGRY
jgi:hypothetical protein